MTLNLEFRPGPVRIGKTIYDKSEFALEYALEQAPPAQSLQASIEAAVGIKQSTWLAIADTLSIVFSGPDAEFVSFDAYGNSEQWIPTVELILPAVTGLGAAYLAEPPRDSDRIDLGVVPKFFYSPRQHRLRIELGRTPTLHYQVSTCLFVGIDAEGLASLDVTDLRFV